MVYIYIWYIITYMFADLYGKLVGKYTRDLSAIYYNFIIYILKLNVSAILGPGFPQ